MQVTKFPARLMKVWPHYVGYTVSRAELAAYIAKMKPKWSIKGITLHNTDLPDLPMWVEWGPKHDQRLINLATFFFDQRRFRHGGPHFFVSRENVSIFTDPSYEGVHSRCWNKSHIGIEMVGNYEVDRPGRKGDLFDSGDGAKVRDNAVFLVARLMEKLKLTPEKNLTFHRECHLDDHACPGSRVKRPDIIARVRAEMKKVA